MRDVDLLICRLHAGRARRRADAQRVLARAAPLCPLILRHSRGMGKNSGDGPTVMIELDHAVVGVHGPSALVAARIDDYFIDLNRAV